MCSISELGTCKLLSLLENCLRFRSLRIQFASQAVFERTITTDTTTANGNDVSRINAYFHTPSIVVTEGQPVDLNLVLSIFNELVDNFTKRGSGYTLAHIEKLTIRFVRYRQLGEQATGSYIPTLKWLRDKQAVINVINSDNRC